VETYCWLAPPVAGCRAAARSLCLQTAGSDLKTAWRLSFSDESELGVCINDDAVHKSTSYLTLSGHVDMTNRLKRSRIGENRIRVK